MKTLLSLLLLFTGVSAGFAQGHIRYKLIMRNRGEYYLWDSTKIATYGFALKLNEQPHIPGPTIYANEGDTVTVSAWNVSQGEPHTIHFHGLDVDQANDGVAHTSFEIKHMEEKPYTFVARHAGTYLYHCHVSSVVHVQMGMYGQVIVRAKDGSMRAWTDGPAFDREYAWLLSEMDTRWHDSIPEAAHDDTTNLHPPVKIPPYRPNYFLVNGKGNWQLSSDTAISIHGKANEKIYLRLSNIGFFENRISFPEELAAEIIDSDGRPLPVSLRQDSIVFSPGERYGVMLYPKQEILDSIRIEYLHMDTHSAWSTEYVPVRINSVSDVAYQTSPFKDFSVFPNPADTRIWIEAGSADGYRTIEISNVLGERLFSAAISGGLATPLPVDISGFAEGLYILSLTGSHGTRSSSLIISR